MLTSIQYSLQGVSLQVLTASVREARLEVGNPICGLDIYSFYTVLEFAKV